MEPYKFNVRTYDVDAVLFEYLNNLKNGTI